MPQHSTLLPSETCFRTLAEVRSSRRLQIRELLQTERQTLEREKAETEVRLRAYESAGPLLEELVAE